MFGGCKLIILQKYRYTKPFIVNFAFMLTIFLLIVPFILISKHEIVYLVQPEKNINLHKLSLVHLIELFCKILKHLC